MASLGRPLDGGDGLGFEGEVVAQKLQHAHLLQPHFEIDRRHFQRRRVGGVVETRRNGLAAAARTPSSPAGSCSSFWQACATRISFSSLKSANTGQVRTTSPMRASSTSVMSRSEAEVMTIR